MEKKQMSLMEVEPQDKIAENEPEIITSEEVSLIDKMAVDINGIFKKSVTDIEKSVTDASYEIGEIIFKGIFEGNPDLVDFKHEQKTKRSKIRQLFNELFKQIQKHSEQGVELPGKTWFYNTAGLVRDRNELSECPEYNKLNTSNRITLLLFKDKEEKIKFAKQAIAEKLSVRQLREIVYSKLDQKQKNLLDYIKNPDEIENIDNFTLEEISKLCPSKKEQEKAIAVCNSRRNSIEKEIKRMTERRDKLDTLMDRLNSFEQKKKKREAKKQ